MVLDFFKVLNTPRLFAVCHDNAVKAVGSKFEGSFSSSAVPVRRIATFLSFQRLAYEPNSFESKGQTILTSVRLSKVSPVTNS